MSKHMTKVAELMADLDLCTFLTRKGDAVAGRPMSNNGQVDYDGDSYFFTRETSGMTADVASDPRVSIAFQRAPGLLAGAPLFLHIQGRAEILRDKAAFAEHWSPDLERWFEDGIDTTGMVMLAVRAERIAYWDGEEEGDFTVPAA